MNSITRDLYSTLFNFFRAINGILECDGGEYEATVRLRFQMYLLVRDAFGLTGEADERGCYN